MKKLPAIGMIAAAILLVYSFFIIHPKPAADQPVEAAEEADILLYVNGEQLQPDAPPQIVKGRTFVPIRWVGEALGAELSWYEPTKTLRITKEDVHLRLSVGSKTARIGDEPTELYAVPFIHLNRTYVPVRWISEALSLEVEWQDKPKAVLIQEMSDETEQP